MKFGLFFQAPEAPGQSHAQRYGEMIDLIGLADTLGFDVAWLAELHFGGAFSLLSKYAIRVGGRPRRSDAPASRGHRAVDGGAGSRGAVRPRQPDGGCRGHCARWRHRAVPRHLLDPIREDLVMSLDTFLGREGNVLGETPRHCRLLKLHSPILTNAELEKIRSVDIVPVFWAERWPNTLSAQGRYLVIRKDGWLETVGREKIPEGWALNSRGEPTTDPQTKATRKIFDTIADNAANAGIVLGGRPIRPLDADLRWIGALCYRNGQLEETGLAAGVLNHPATAVAWLANKIAPNGLSLEAGQVVLAGSFIRPIETRKGDTIQADYGPYGSVSCYFA